jgi:hypothetical protein
MYLQVSIYWSENISLPPLNLSPPPPTICQYLLFQRPYCLFCPFYIYFTLSTWILDFSFLFLSFPFMFTAFSRSPFHIFLRSAISRYSPPPGHIFLYISPIFVNKFI